MCWGEVLADLGAEIIREKGTDKEGTNILNE